MSESLSETTSLLKMKDPDQRSQSHYHHIIFIMILAGIPLWRCQQITVNDPSVDVQSLCPGDVITLTCQTQGSPLIAWRSIDYVSTAIGNQLEFDEFEDIGTTRPSLAYSTTIAELTNISRIPVLELVSQLRITIRSDVTSSSVICVHNNGNTDTITLRLLDTPGEVDIISDQRKNATGGCTVHYSWGPPSNVDIRNIKHFAVAFNGSNSEIVDKTEENVYMREHSVCTCATHSVSVTVIDRCNRTGNNSDHIVRKEPVSQLDARCDGIAAMRTDPCPQPTCSKIAIIIVSITLGVYVAISLVVIILMAVGVIPTCANRCECGEKCTESSVSYEMSRVTPEKD